MRRYIEQSTWHPAIRETQPIASVVAIQFSSF